MDRSAIAARSARDLEEQRRKHEQFASMMDEVGGLDTDDSDSEDSDDAPVRRRPVRRRGGAAGRGGGAAGSHPASYGGGGGGGAGAGGGGYGGAAAAAEAEDKAVASFGVASSAELPVAMPPAGDSKAAAPLSPAHVDRLRPTLLRATHPSAGVVRCTVMRLKSGKHMLSPLWIVYNDEGMKFMMSAKKRMGKKTSNFLITMDPNGGDRKSALVVGKVRANWTGSGYYVYDEGMNPAKALTEASRRRELVFVAFDYDSMGPGKMEIVVPRVSGAGVASVVRPRDDKESLEVLYKSDDTERCMFLANKRPKWDETVKGHVLNFNGRVTMSSVKNFQLACTDTEDATVLQFGRVGKHRFTMDFQYPLSPVQAFGIVLASLDGKLADSKGFQAVKKKFGGGGGDKPGMFAGLRAKLGGGKAKK